MERVHVNYLRELVHRLRLRQSERGIALDLGLSRNTVGKYRQLAKAAGYLDLRIPLPEAATIASGLGPEPAPPLTASTVLPYQ